MADQIDSLNHVTFNNDAPEAPQQPVEGDTLPMKKKSPMGPKILMTLMIVLAGVGTGYALNQVLPAPAATAGQAATQLTNSSQVKVNEVYGSKDQSKFPDTAEGVLVRGGVAGEGSHHLMREGGPSRNVYLTSSVLDLSLFEGAKVKVWGETYASQKAGWLMDVGGVQVEELNAPKPFEEDTTTQVIPD